MNAPVQLPPRLKWEYRLVIIPAKLGDVATGSVDAIADASLLAEQFTDAGEKGYQVVGAGPSYVLLGRIAGVLEAPESSGLVGVVGGLPPLPGVGR